METDLHSKQRDIRAGKATSMPFHVLRGHETVLPPCPDPAPCCLSAPLSFIRERGILRGAAGELHVRMGMCVRWGERGERREGGGGEDA